MADLPPELGPPIRTFGPDRTLTLIGFGMAGVLAVLAVIFLIITTADDPPFPIPKNSKWRYAMPAGLAVTGAVAVLLSQRSWGHRVYVCPNGVACLRQNEVQHSLWADLAGVTCSRAEPRRLDTDHLQFTAKVGRPWGIAGRDVREFKALCDLLREGAGRHGVSWKAIAIET